MTTSMPTDVARVAAIMAGFQRPWALCGGWAVDAWLGQVTRAHSDVDLIVFEGDQHVLRQHLAGYQLVAHDDHWDGKVPIWHDKPIPETELWDGRTVEVPGHFHIRADDGFDFEVNLIEVDGDDWVVHREPRLVVPLAEALVTSPWGIAAVSPALVAYHKVVGVPEFGITAPMRDKDHADVSHLDGLLTAEARDWLRSAVGVVAPGHPWLKTRLET